MYGPRSFPARGTGRDRRYQYGVVEIWEVHTYMEDIDGSDDHAPPRARTRHQHSHDGDCCHDEPPASHATNDKYNDDDDDDDDPKGPPTLYDVLFCAPDASTADLKKAYKQQALHWHPDKNTDPDAEERFKQVSTAWRILSDDNERAAYDRSLVRGTTFQEGNKFQEGNDSYRRYQEDAAACRAAFEAFQRAEEALRRREQRRERGLLIGACSLAVWAVLIFGLLSQFLGHVAVLFPPPLEVSNLELARYPLALSFSAFSERLASRHTAKLRTRESALRPPEWLPPWAGVLMREHTPYLRIALNRTSELRRAPEVGRPGGRGYLLVSSQQGEDIYGRQVRSPICSPMISSHLP